MLYSQISSFNCTYFTGVSEGTKVGGKQTGTQEFQPGEPRPTMNLFSELEQGASPP